MIPDVSKALSWLEAHPEILNGIQRGIERETLRVTPQGALAETLHSDELGKPLPINGSPRILRNPYLNLLLL